MIDEQHVFNNRYRLETKLGEGGMASVYCGTDTLLRRRVAIKVLHAQYAADEEFVRRFYQEAESAARLSHPNIVNTYDVGREGDTYYIVMELVDGPSLADIIATDGKLPEPVAIDYAAQICNGLAYAHRQGLLHRDIKPANILITKDDVVKLSDFGIARAISQQTMTMTRPGLVMGSVYYLSPEQAQGAELHETSDLYSVGIVLYQMLTGKVPYAGDSPVTVALKHIGDPVPTLDSDAAVSPALAGIVNKLLQKQPENRFSSATQVASALREARERPSVAAYPSADDSPTQALSTLAPPPRPSPMPDRRSVVESADDTRARRSGIAVLAVLAAALIAAIVAGYYAANHRSLGVARVRINDYRGMTQAQAQRALQNAGLSAHIVRTPSSAVASGHVWRQDPAPGTLLGRGAIVTLTVSSGKPAIAVRDVVGYTLADAQKALTGQKLIVSVIQRYDRSPKDTVLSQDPAPGKKIAEGSSVTLAVSQGPAPVAMPELVGLTLGAATALAAKDGFSINVVDRTASDNIPANQIASQDVAPGTMMPGDRSGKVNVAVSTGAGYAGVPDTSGSDLITAQQTITQAGFQPSVEYAIDPDSADNGKVIGQQPAAGAQAEKGSKIMLTVSVPGAVPNTANMDLDAAKTLLIDDGYQVGNVTPTTEGANGLVVRTEPEAGTKVRLGTPVNVYVNSASAQPQPR